MATKVLELNYKSDISLQIYIEKVEVDLENYGHAPNIKWEDLPKFEQAFIKSYERMEFINEIKRQEDFD